MNKTPVFGKRLRWGAAVLSALLLAGGGLASLQSTAQAASSDGQESPNDVQSQDGSGDTFSGYSGYVGDDAQKVARVHEPAKKAEGLGKIASSEGHSPDVPGEVVPESRPASPDLMIPSAPSAAQVAAVRKVIDRNGAARVIVMTNAQVGVEANLSASAVRAQRQGIATSLNDLQTTVAGTGSRLLLTYKVVPSAVYNITRAGLNALLRDPNVVSVVLDGQVQGELDSSTQVIQSDALNTAGVLGNNFEGSTTGAHQVAIIDSGVDNGHNAFAGRIVSEACFVTDFSCPGGTNSALGPGTADDCTHSTDCDHGTHVGGIAAGTFYTGGHEGVARGAGLVAIKVAQDNPASARWVAQFSSIDLALQRVLNLKNSGANLVSVNLSIGGGLFNSGDPACNATNPNTNNLMGQLQAAGVAVVVSSGNDGSTTQMSFPACLSNAFAVGATNDADVPASFSNSNPSLRWWAPGVSITAPVPTGNNEGTKDGTSMAAPHVAGSFALLRECVDGNGIPQTNAAAASNLDATGVNVTRNGVTRKRINVLDAATRTVNNNDFAAPETLPATPPASGFNDFDFNVCADSEVGEPGPFSLDNSIWWQWTPSATGTATISTEDNGTNVTTFDTTLTVYTGNTLNSLTTVASDDDSGTGLRSQVVFPVNAGTTYRIKVDGFGAQNGLLNLHTELGPPPACGGVAATQVGTINGEVINGTAGNDVIVAGSGNDTINGLDGNDRVCGDDGDDTINVGAGDDFVLAGPGADSINGSDGADTLVGNAGAGDTNDVGDTINGGMGNDFLDGWVGDDRLIGGPGDDQLRGEAGIDIVDYNSSAAAVNVNVAGNSATGQGTDSFVLVENVRGSPQNDIILGDGVANVVHGGSGADVVNGLGGNDSLFGDPGNDQVTGGSGNDFTHGGLDKDTAVYSGSPAGVNVDLASFTGTGDGTDEVRFFENITGSSFNDVLAGDALNNTLRGGPGPDNLSGRAGNDTMIGGTGNDTCNGGAGAGDTANTCEGVVGVP